MSNQTVMEPEGLFLLEPVWFLLFVYLETPKTSVSVRYETYRNNYKGVQIRPDDQSIFNLQDAVKQGLTPGRVLL